MRIHKHSHAGSEWVGPDGGRQVQRSCRQQRAGISNDKGRRWRQEPGRLVEQPEGREIFRRKHHLGASGKARVIGHLNDHAKRAWAGVLVIQVERVVGIKRQWLRAGGVAVVHGG